MSEFINGNMMKQPIDFNFYYRSDQRRKNERRINKSTAFSWDNNPDFNAENLPDRRLTERRCNDRRQINANT